MSKCTPVEVDPRLAAFKRWWAWRYGSLLDTVAAARSAMEDAEGFDSSMSAGAREAVDIWDTYESQPAVRQILLQRMLELVENSTPDGRELSRGC